MIAKNLFVHRPPEYFPALPFWALALHADTVIVADTFQYSKQSLQNRSRLRTPDGWQWITIPLKGGQRGHPIAEVEIDNTVPWRGKHRRSLQYNYRSAPYFEAYEDLFDAFFDADWSILGDATIASMRIIAGLLELPTPGQSSLGDALPEGHREILLKQDHPTSDSVVLEFEHPIYSQNFPGFEPGLSALDLIFNYGPEASEIIRRGSGMTG